MRFRLLEWFPLEGVAVFMSMGLVLIKGI